MLDMYLAHNSEAKEASKIWIDDIYSELSSYAHNDYPHVICYTFSIGENEFTKQVQEYADKEGSQVIVMCAKLESELSGLEDEDRKVFMEDLGLNASGLDMLIKATYDLLGLKTFFTSGTDECRAWTFKNGMKAPECAGIIHTDFQKGFIKAEVMSYEDLESLGSEKAVQEAGKLRLEGKEYVMQDGDICFFRFNVTK
jgi:ribosome-binding ATPase YchF (GTP1/OBG family)